jgi:two-component system NtrC family sensor kinase
MPSRSPTLEALYAEGLRSVVSLPLMARHGPVGFLSLASVNPGEFPAEHLDIAREVAAQLAVALQQARLYEAEREQFRQKQELQAQLAQADKLTALGRLVASITHEISNPLQAIQFSLGAITLEMAAEKRWDKLERYVSRMSGEIHRIAELAQRLRDFYRPAREEMQPTQVSAVIRDVLELTGKQLEHSHITLERDCPDDLPAIQANPDHLKQVFLNLMLNAIDAMAPKGHGVLRVRAAMDQMLSPNTSLVPALRIEFADTGTGIPPEVMSRLFEPFVTTKTDGTGLGLSISYGIVRAHGGQIAVLSEVGVGTKFTLLLPAASAPDRPG